MYVHDFCGGIKVTTPKNCLNKHLSMVFIAELSKILLHLCRIQKGALDFFLKYLGIVVIYHEFSRIENKYSQNQP